MSVDSLSTVLVTTSMPASSRRARMGAGCTSSTSIRGISMKSRPRSATRSMSGSDSSLQWDVQAMAWMPSFIAVILSGLQGSHEQLRWEFGGGGEARLGAPSLHADRGDAIRALGGLGQRRAPDEEVGEAPEEGVARAGRVQGLDRFRRHMALLVGRRDHAAAR